MGQGMLQFYRFPILRCFSVPANEGGRNYPMEKPQEGKNPSQESVIVHHSHSTCVKADSAVGSQKVMSMARYNSMAVESAARANSSRPVWRYSVTRPW